MAYIRGVRDYVTAFDRGTGKEQVVAILTKYTTIKNPALFDQMIPSGILPDGQVNAEMLQKDLDYYIGKGLVPSTFQLSQAIDTSFDEYAIQQLGHYQAAA